MDRVQFYDRLTGQIFFGKYRNDYKRSGLMPVHPALSLLSRILGKPHVSALRTARLFQKHGELCSFLLTAGPIFQSLVEDRYTRMIIANLLVGGDSHVGPLAGIILTGLSCPYYIIYWFVALQSCQPFNLFQQSGRYRRRQRELRHVERRPRQGRNTVTHGFRDDLYHLINLESVDRRFLRLQRLLVRVPSLCAALDIQEFGEVRTLFVAAGPSFVRVVKHRMSWMVKAIVVLIVVRIELLPAAAMITVQQTRLL